MNNSKQCRIETIGADGLSKHLRTRCSNDGEGERLGAVLTLRSVDLVLFFSFSDTWFILTWDLLRLSSFLKTPRGENGE
ncbi:hypothetical protein L6164_011225 [Bauhinia variegata]|uniref:Uncharacterized protein n=1 Tax=Bauhinia variegata TaxID=167791 RepID=A0ACB9P7E5_BAUVA|nr:hypothetical protein L6164_011225 [Bauhinia variegata]